MVTGKAANEQKAAQQNAKAQSALQPKSYSDPFGSFSNGQYNPNMSDTQKNTLSTTQQAINGYTQALQQPFDINSYYNNPFYDTTYSQLSAPVNRQYEQDAKQLQNDLNAKGQLGSSYDALMNSKLQQNRDYNLNQSQLQARSASADAYNQAYQNALAGLQGLNQSQLAQQQYLYQPMNMAMAYQQAMTPLQQGQAGIYNNTANYYQNKKTFMDNYLDYMKSASQAAGSIAAAAA